MTDPFDQLVEAAAQRAAQLVLEQLEPPPAASPLMTVGEAATYMRCSPGRVYNLLSRGSLTRLKDGSKVLLERGEIDRYLAGR
jgi:excisionase family DNA binding protein